jgi:UDP-2,3-diacylglucosamine hydrolase
VTPPRTLFVADLHLDAARPAATAAFCDFLQGPAREAERLYILGDLFEAWIGDDDPDEHHARVRAALGNYTAAGHPCFFMPGNRDFLLGPGFTGAAGLTLLPDPTLIEVAGTSLIISHGDALCTDDHAYQRFRRIARNPRLIAWFRRLPFAARRRIVAGARRSSQQAVQTKPPAVMDVNQDAVEELLRRHRLTTLLHGHTHRPAEHKFTVDGQPALRIVLGDWYKDGPVLSWDATGRRTERLAFAAA